MRELLRRLVPDIGFLESSRPGVPAPVQEADDAVELVREEQGVGITVNRRGIEDIWAPLRQVDAHRQRCRRVTSVRGRARRARAMSGIPPGERRRNVGDGLSHQVADLLAVDVCANAFGSCAFFGVAPEFDVELFLANVECERPRPCTWMPTMEANTGDQS
jgi:hypothetical protein